MQQIQYLSKNVFQLKCIGHNSSKFDLPALQQEIMQIVDLKEIKAIRKGASFFSLSIGQINFMDSMHFVPMSLANFCSTFNVQQEKGVWPYEYFKSEAEIFNTKEFPSITAFHSSLCRKNETEKFAAEFQELLSKFSSESEMKMFFGIKSFIGNDFYVSPKDYFVAKNKFDGKMKSGEWTSMFDMLVEYNMQDCIILHKAMSNFSETVSIAFQTEVLAKLSLPGLSEGMFS